MTYLYGHQSEEIGRLQTALADLGLYRGKIDNGFGDKTRDAVIEAQILYGIDPHDGVVRADLLLELGITAPKTPRSNPLQDWLLSVAIKTAVSKLKDSPMFANLSGYKTTIIGIVSVFSGVISLAAPVIGLGDVPGFNALSPGEAWTAITTGFGLIFLRAAVAKTAK